MPPTSGAADLIRVNDPAIIPSIIHSMINGWMFSVSKRHEMLTERLNCVIHKQCLQTIFLRTSPFIE